MDGTGVNLTLVARNLWGEMSRGWRNQDEDMLAGSRGGTVMTAERGGMDGIRGCDFSPNFTIHLSHQIFCLMHGVLNVCK